MGINKDAVREKLEEEFIKNAEIASYVHDNWLETNKGCEDVRKIVFQESLRALNNTSVWILMGELYDGN